jgi:hypothetical protein
VIEVENCAIIIHRSQDAGKAAATGGGEVHQVADA